MTLSLQPPVLQSQATLASSCSCSCNAKYVTLYLACDFAVLA